MKFLRIASKVILVIVFLNLFGYAVRYVHVGGKNLGVATQPLIDFVRFPETVFTVVHEVKEPEYLVWYDTNFEWKNELTYDVFGLGSIYKNGQWEFRLRNFRTDSIHYTWTFTRDMHESTERVFTHLEPRNPILFKDTSLVITLEETNNMFRLDKHSKKLWHNTDYKYHHSLNIDADSNIWACGRYFVQVKNRFEKKIEFWENTLVKIDPETGKIIFTKDLSQILADNGYSYMIHGMGNSVMPDFDDPFHLNDIQPVLTDGPYWKRGDLFISLRHRSAIILYRPESNKILRMIQGPFYNQHDIDIQDSTKISFFNNNFSALESNNPGKSPTVLKDSLHLSSISQILIYDFADSTFTPYHDSMMVSEGIYTRTQGFHEILSNGDVFVESQNSGSIFVLAENRAVYKAYYDTPKNRKVARPHWIRIFESVEL